MNSGFEHCLILMSSSTLNLQWQYFSHMITPTIYLYHFYGLEQLNSLSNVLMLNKTNDTARMDESNLQTEMELDTCKRGISSVQIAQEILDESLTLNSALLIFRLYVIYY